jgi:tRNA A37 threonylcarbamoyladenosine synthetase subunit TsaC/SUA5/YrdC
VGAPTIKLVTTNAPLGAPTIALKTANTPLPGAPTIALKTANAPLVAGGAATIPLPKATVALNPPTKPLSPTSAAATQKPTLSTVEEAEDETGADTFAKVLAGVGLVAALLVLGIQLKISNIWIGAEDNDRNGDWSLLLE